MRLSLDDRYSIKNLLEERRPFSEIAQNIGVSGSTVSREIKNHYILQRSGGHGIPFNNCANRYHCTIHGICDSCFNNRKCRNCSKLCVTFCKSFKKEECERLSKPPYVCNGCPKRGTCTLEKHVYDPSFAQNEYMDIWKESHTGLSYSEDEIKNIDNIVTPLTLKGQSVNHILLNHSDELMVSKSTIYRLIDDGVLNVKNIDLPRKVRYRARKKPRAFKVDKKCRIGRTYDDYQVYLNEHPDTAVVQMDSVEGIKGGKVLLTIHFVKSEFMLAYLRDANDAASVIRCFDKLYEILGHDNFKRIFPLVLGDNGSEFSDPVKIECDWRNTGLVRTKVFYCDPGAYYQKGSAERNHEFIRCIIPKGVDIGKFTQDDIDVLVNHINSYCRDSIGGKCPYDAFSFFYGSDITEKLGVRKIDPDDVTLKPSLLKKKAGSDNESD